MTPSRPGKRTPRRPGAQARRASPRVRLDRIKSARSRDASTSRWTRKDGKPASLLYQEIWRVVCAIPRGRVATYGQVAKLAGRPGQPRLVGYALRSLPEGTRVPWHRVINAQGAVSRRAGFTGGEESYQQHLLEKEGVVFGPSGQLDLARYQWRPR